MRVYLISILFALFITAEAQQYHASLNSLFEITEVAYFDPPDAFSALEGGLMIKAAGVYGESTLRYGWFLNYIPTNYVFRYDFDLQMIGLGGIIGAAFGVNDNIEIQPLMQLGYRISIPEGDVDSYNGLALNLDVNGIYWMDGNVHPKVNFGFLTQPAGGNSDITFTFSPQWFIGAGVVIADN